VEKAAVKAKQASTAKTEEAPIEDKKELKAEKSPDVSEFNQNGELEGSDH
jgi:hypothetical protein